MTDLSACRPPLTALLLCLGAGALSCHEEPPPPADADAADGVAAQASAPAAAAEAGGEAVASAASVPAADAAVAESGSPLTAGETPPAPEAEDTGPGAGGFWSQATTLEERAANVRRALAAAGDGPVHLDIHDLGGWDFDENAEQPFPEHVLALDGRRVVLRGFMLPDVDFENIRTFHLVRSLWACCFGAPPGPNELVRVTVVDGDGIDYTYQTLEVEGTFHVVFEMTDGLLDDLYRLDADRVVELGFDDPLAPATVSPEERKKLGEFVGTDVEF